MQSGNPDRNDLPGPLDRFSWRYQLREFQSRFHVVAVDLRGYGSTDAPRGVDSYTIDLLMADIQDVILGLGGDAPLSQTWPPQPLPHLYLVPILHRSSDSPLPHRLLQVHPSVPRLGCTPSLEFLHLLPIPG